MQPTSDYVATRKLEGSPDWQTIRVSAEDLVSNDLNITSPLADWQHVTDLQLSPTYQGGTKGRVNFPGKAWQGPRRIRNLRWEGGQYATVRPLDSNLSEEHYECQFNAAIQQSLEQELLGQSKK